MHNIVHSPVAHARRINEQYDLSTIRIGLLDEIFQAADPVLVGVDAASTFCFLLSPEEQRDADTWASGCWNWSTEASLPRPPSPISPRGAATGTRRLCMRSPAAVMFFMPCTTSGRWSVTWRTGPTKHIDPRAKLERKQATAKRRGRKDQNLLTKLSYARPAEAKAIALADEVALLARWLRDDILSVAGPEYAIRRDLLDFVVAELVGAGESACPHRIRPVRTLLEKQRDNLLSFCFGTGP